MAMTDVYLGLGSNLGDRKAMLRAAIMAIKALPTTKLIAQSDIKETPPVGPEGQNDYLNMALHIKTALSPDELIESTQQIELDMGREPVGERIAWGPRDIDIDILLFGSIVLETERLIIPHPMMTQRLFVLEPLVQIAPDAVHPPSGMKAKTLLKQLKAMIWHHGVWL